MAVPCPAPAPPPPLLVMAMAALLLLLVPIDFGSAAEYDLYVDAADVESLIGLSARLYYVRGGRAHANAARYAVEVPPSVNAVNVTWCARPGPPLFYRLSVDADPNSPVAPMLTNVPAEGTVPDVPTVFAVSLSCSAGTGRAATVVRLSVSTAVDRPPAADAAAATAADADVGLVFRKVCAVGPPDPPVRVVEIVDDRTDGGRTSTPEPNRLASPYYGPAFFYHMVAAASSLAALAVIWCLTTVCRRDKARGLMIIKGLKSAINSTNKFNHQNLAGFKTKDLHECVAELSVHRRRVSLLNAELEGTFGRVYRGVYTDIGGKDEEVFVKTVTDQASAAQVSVLLHEGLSLYGFAHKNVLAIMAVSVEQNVEPYLLYPYNDNKNLKKFLQNCKSSESISFTLTTREIINMTVQIVNGMQYLHKNKHLHKDVAARNCLVNPELKIQIADNALSRDLFPADYHCLGDNKNRPIKWMAVESLEHKKFSPASDIWSFGVLLWELLTLCQQPYSDIDPFEMLAYLQDGFRLNQPVNCPDELFTVMACCWALEPNERPAFSQLSVFLNDFNNQLVKFV